MTGGSSDGGAVDPGTVGGVSSYTVLGNRLITPMHEDTSYSCLGTELRTTIKKTGPDSADFQVLGDTLKIANAPDTTSSGAILHLTSIFARVGTGSGLEGKWKLSDQSYQVISGTLTSVEKDNYENDIANSKHIYSSYVTATVELSGGKITSTVDANTAGLFMESWNGSNPVIFHKADSTKYDMTAKAIDAHTLEFHGRKTGETVRLVMTSSGGNFTGDIVYTSDKAGNAEFHYNVKSKTCPNPAQPDWYVAFQNANMKPGTKAKIGEIPAEKDFSPAIPFIPLKSAYSFLN